MVSEPLKTWEQRVVDSSVLHTVYHFSSRASIDRISSPLEPGAAFLGNVQVHHG